MRARTEKSSQSEGRLASPATAPELRIGYLPVYVDYYESICPEFGPEKAAAARHCADVLATHGTLIWNGELVRNVEQAAVTGKWLAEQNADCIVVFTTIAVFGGIPWAALQSLSAPILLWNAQAIETVGRGYTMVEIVRNTGQIGAQALANTLMREGRWFRVVTGYEKGKRTVQDLQRFFRIIRAVRALQRARLLSVGGAFPTMTDILVDDQVLRNHLGATVTYVSAGQLTERYHSISEPAMKAGVEEIRRYDIRELTQDELVRSARLCEAVKSLVSEHGADAGTVNCHRHTCIQNPSIGITACYSLGIQNSVGRPFTCTGDLATALAMLLLKRLTGVAMYTEVQVMDERRKAIVIANSGEGEEGIRRNRCRSVVQGNTNFIGKHGRGASFAYPLRPGPATVVSFTQSPKGTKPFRLIVAEGEILHETLPDTGALAGFFRFSKTDLHSAYTRWLEAGPVHHAATTPGLWTRELAAVAELLDLELITI